ncbi:D-alanyl-D-alanine carboxypeptidase [Anopheles sinensis]|uniref:D-alanyl-D-alanine carboxypeptidase n=1 Tax=Anopheles sinensis TaxID=74873 RepID=A0A084VBL8_ANOSI|nr:D-alanyl-D-alanine carboxypeptidase [Anopheles sinensis]
MENACKAPLKSLLVDGLVDGIEVPGGGTVVGKGRKTSQNRATNFGENISLFLRS